MPTRRHGLTGLVCALGLLAGGCAARMPPLVASHGLPTPVDQPSPVVVRPPAPDPVGDLLALAESYFESGERELADGHLSAAKSAFDRAVDVLLESPGGARSSTRLSEYYDGLVERISSRELAALAQADGFAEKSSEPASIDELLSSPTFDPPAATAQTEQAVASDLETVIHDIEIPQNKRVLAYVQLFTGRLKGYLEEGLSRGARYLPMIQDVFRSEGLPLDLAYVPLIESAFKPNALSRAKAKGMWQFMRGTALENGLQHDWYIDERADPEKATRAAAKYLKTLYAMFDDWHLALASYNGGPGRVQRAIKRSGRSDFWKLSASGRYLPRETRDYVPLILAAIIIARNPEQYEMNIAQVDTPLYETVAVSGAVDLRQVAEWTGASVQEIQDLNPELRRWTTPVRATDYELKVPEGTASVINDRLAEIGPDALAPLNYYIVKKNDTLLSVAKKLRVSRADLAQANYLSVKARLQIGQELIIPRAPSLLVAQRTAPTGSAPDVVLASHEVRVSDAPVRSSTHRVQRGETLFSIARRYGTTVDQIKEWNDLRGSVIRVGQRLIVDSGSTLSTN